MVTINAISRLKKVFHLLVNFFNFPEFTCIMPYLYSNYNLHVTRNN